MTSYTTHLPPEKPSSFCFSLKEHQQVKGFLNSCALPQYFSNFINEGFESIQAVLEVTEEDLIALNVERGHRRVIQRGIVTLNDVPKNQPLSMVNPTSCTFNFSRSKSNNGNHSSEGSSGTYSASGCGSMRSPNHTASLNGQPSYESTENTTTAEHPLHFRHHHINQPSAPQPQPQPDTSPQLVILDDQMKESRSSVSSNDEEDDDEDEDEDDAQQNDISQNSKTSSSSPLKRKYRRHPKPDKNAPLKPPSAYIMFSNDARAQLKDHSMTFVQIAKLVGDQWKNLSLNQKQAYERTAMRAKDKYIDALNAYRQTKEYKEYQTYLKNFKAEQDAMNRKIAGLRKRAKRDSPGSGSLADSSSNGNDLNDE